MRPLLLAVLLAAPVFAADEKPAEPAKAEAPKAEAPKTEAPKVETPKAEEKPALTPPAIPERAKELNSASQVALDLAKTISYLEQAQVYYKAYAKGTHTAAENKAFVRFAEDYDAEVSNAKRELEVLRTWLEKKADLKPE